MPSSPHLNSAVVSARQALKDGRSRLQHEHDQGARGQVTSARLTDVVDDAVLQLFQSALESLPAEQRLAREQDVALVAHGGYGRRDVAPYSDVDLMLLHGAGSESDVAPLAGKLSQHIVDAGMQLGFSTRTVPQACRMAIQDPVVYTSLVESRYLTGKQDLFDRFWDRFARETQKRNNSVVAAIIEARLEERRKYGETNYLLRPNIKRTRGGLREMQLVRWLGFARYGTADPAELCEQSFLSQEDLAVFQEAYEFLLHLRNEVHFHAGKAQDVLEKAEQVRLADKYGFSGSDGTLPVEQFMRAYFDHTSNVRYLASNFTARAKRRASVKRMIEPMLSHQIEDIYRVGPVHIGATGKGRGEVRGDLSRVLRLMSLANLYDKRIDHYTWQAIRDAMMSQDSFDLTPGTIEQFLALFDQPAKLGEMLRRLHQLRVLEKLVPAMAHARCLLQFNEYHKYTVDEHSIRAVEEATEFQNHNGQIGEVYRGLKNKRLLHLALLLHDLGKGFPEDHSVVGAELAEQTAEHLRLSASETEQLVFLVRHHLQMAHLAFRRDLHDKTVIVQFAVEVGSPELLQMLYVLTAADLAAVGPNVLNDWKLNLLTELYQQAMHQLSGGQAGQATSRRSSDARDRVLGLTLKKEDTAWWERQIAELPSSYLLDSSPEDIVDQLTQLQVLPHTKAVAWGRYRDDVDIVEYTVGAYEEITPGVFHRLTGVLSHKRHTILSAEINTLDGSLILDRFFVHDRDFEGEPPPERLEEISRALVKALEEPSDEPPRFRKEWKARHQAEGAVVNRLPTRVHVDNSSAERYTIIDIFAHNETGLLYKISRELFRLDLSIHVAKIGTYLDQVVDVFYVTESRGGKLAGESRIAEVRQRLLEAIDENASQ